MALRDKGIKAADAPVYSYWAALWRSFYSYWLYVDVGKRWRGLGQLYLLLVILLVSIPFVGRMMYEFNRAFYQNLITPIKVLPTLMIQNGEVKFDKAMPYEVKNQAGEVVALIDTSGRVTSFSAAYPKLNILINKNSISFRAPVPDLFESLPADQGFFPESKKYFPAEVNEVFVPEQWLDSTGVKGVYYFSLAMIYPVVAAVFYGLCSTLFFIFALMGQFMSRIFFDHSLGYRQSCRLLAVSSTPTLFYGFMMMALNWQFNGFGLSMLVLLGLYFNFGLLALKRESRKVARR